MNGIINFDNAATSYPKPACVAAAARSYFERYGGNPGRGGHDLSMRSAAAVYSVRSAAADFFGARPENTVFTAGCTHALNLAIKGVMQGGGHIIMSDMEHNSVSRPIYSLPRDSCGFSISKISADDDETVENFRSLIRGDTRAAVFTVASNVTGQLIPYKRIAEICRERGICFILDGAQGCGMLPLKLCDGINILCTAGHKGLFGATGTGLLITDGRYEIPPMMQGGGGNSLELTPPDYLPDSLENGTLNTLGILTLGAGLDFVKRIGTERIFSHESELCAMLESFLRRTKGAVVYREAGAKYLPILSFNIEGMSSEEVSGYLNRRGFALRGGFHCAALTHKKLGTEQIGAVRFSPSVFSRKSDVMRLCGAIGSCIRENKKI